MREAVAVGSAVRRQAGALASEPLGERAARTGGSAGAEGLFGRADTHGRGSQASNGVIPDAVDAFLAAVQPFKPPAVPAAGEASARRRGSGDQATASVRGTGARARRRGDGFAVVATFAGARAAVMGQFVHGLAARLTTGSRPAIEGAAGPCTGAASGAPRDRSPERGGRRAGRSSPGPPARAR